jgi:hypothetical protein
MRSADEWKCWERVRVANAVQKPMNRSQSNLSHAFYRTEPIDIQFPKNAA